VGPLLLRVHWWGDATGASAWLAMRAFVYKEKRSALPRVASACAAIVLLPVRLFNLALILVELPVAIFWGFSRQLTGRRSPDKTLFLEVIDALQRVSGATRFLPTTLILNAFHRLKRSEKWRWLFDDRPHILYLRSFKMDARKVQAEGNSGLYADLEVVLGASVKSVGPFVAVGAEQDAWGSRFVRVPALDDSWKETVRKLIEDSGYVLLVPEDTEGTFWEMETIAKNPSYLAKTVILNIAAAGRSLPSSERERIVYSEDDGRAFLEFLCRISSQPKDSFPPLLEICSAVAVSGELHLICVREHMGQATAWAESTRSASISSERTRDGLCGADTPGNGVSPLSQCLISCPGRIESSPGGSRSQAASSSMPTGRSQRRAASAGHRRGDGASAAAAPEGWRDHYGSAARSAANRGAGAGFA
jgi:hypothetical protein